MTIKKALIVTTALLMLTVTGCQGTRTPGGPSVVFDHRTISIQDLASRLGMRIDEEDASFVVLRDGTNTVLVFTHEGGRFFVNGKPIGPVGTIRKSGQTTYVAATLVDQIRANMGEKAIAPARRSVRPRRAVIVVDPGHGGNDPGAIAANGGYEKTVNLAVAAKLAALLGRQGYQVTMTRQDDRYPDLDERALVANRLSADLFVSIHADSAEDPSAQGFTVYIAENASRASREVAQDIVRAMATTGSRSRGVREADYRVLVNTRGPAVLIELGYLSNYREAAKLQDGAFQSRLAAAIAAGINDYFR